MPDDAQPYHALTPDLMLNAVESLGLHCDGRLLALNSYENRVYQIGIEEAQPVIAKFYRPHRWSDNAILEEHAFALQLMEQEIPVVAPIVYCNGQTLHQFESYRFALYPRKPGRAPELDDSKTLQWMGRFIARMHAVGSVQNFAHRPTLNIETFGYHPVRFLVEQNVIPLDLLPSYTSLTKDVLKRIELCFERAVDSVINIRLHGDCHPGNILWTDDGPHFVDLDDSRMAPAIQDIWMLLSGNREEMNQQLHHVMKGYSQFYEFNYRELYLLEALRTLRMLHYSAWLARRWNDPAFPIAFPWFNTQRYWQDQILALREQAALLDEPPLSLE